MDMNILGIVSLSALDWGIIFAFFAVSMAIGVWASKSAGQSSEEFFLGGRSMPWWLLGVSMVATTFSTDTPNLVADLVRQGGVAGNWGWWAFLLSGMLTVFVFAKLWRRSAVTTDVEFYELRYSGKPAAFLRGFRSLYLGLVFNVIIMAGVSLAVVKFGEIVLEVPGWLTLTVAGVVTLIYSSLGGLKGVIWTDFVQFILAMIGSIWAVMYIIGLDSVGGIETILNHAAVDGKTGLFPDFTDSQVWIPAILIPLAITWWATCYPGSEPGGGGYIVQRMLSAKDEKNAIGATFFFNVAHYALRPWPWIIIALASMVLVPMKIDRDYSKNHLKPHEKTVEKINKNLPADAHENMLIALERSEDKAEKALSEADSEKGKKAAQGAIDNINRLEKLAKEHKDSIEIKALAYIWHHKSYDADKKQYKAPEEQADPVERESLVHMYLVNNVEISRLGHDLGYPTMLKLLPDGLIGLVAASLIAAFMSTMSTQVNLGASYLVNDFYGRFINKEASPKQLVNAGRLVTVFMLFLGSFIGLQLESASQAFDLLILIGAGTGPVFILRWFWWRVSAISELVAMSVALILSACKFAFISKEFANDYGWEINLAITAINTVIWVTATYLTSGTSKEVLSNFYKRVQPGGPGWSPVRAGLTSADLDGEEKWDVPTGILCTIFGSIAVYTALFATGAMIYGESADAMKYLAICAVSFFLVFTFWKKLKMK